MTQKTTINDDIIKGEHECYVCKEQFSWLAIVRGNHKEEIIKSIFNPDTIGVAIAYKSGVWDNGKASGAELEIQVRCPKCNCINKINSHIVTWKTDN